jgi:hypothetical protein
MLSENRYYVTQLGILYSEEILGYYKTISGAKKRFKKAIEKLENGLGTAEIAIVDMWTNLDVERKVVTHTIKYKVGSK